MIDPRSVRLVPELRSVHLVRHLHTTPARLLYLERNYDLGDRVVPRDIEEVTVRSAVMRLWRSDATVLELPEPLWMRFFPKTLAFGLVWKLSGAVRGHRREIASYCMENNDLERLVGGDRRAPRALVTAAGLIIGTYTRLVVDRLAFATTDSREVYSSLPLVDVDTAPVFTELSVARESSTTSTAGRFLFVGALEERKGLTPLMSAWEAVEADSDDHVLTIVGQGDLADDVAAWADARPRSRRFLGLRSREDVLELMESSRVLVAPSVASGRWKEQVGLPIKEALSTGLTIVTTDQTGLASWLESHGHHVLASDPSSTLADRLGQALRDADRDPLAPSAVQESLPPDESRYEADAWMHAARAGQVTVQIVNPLGKALAHYTEALAHHLREAGQHVKVHSFLEPSATTSGKLSWLTTYVRTVRSAARAARGDGSPVLVTWPVLGFLDNLILTVIARRTATHLVVHDPDPLVSAVGHAPVVRRLAARRGHRTGVIVHSQTALDVVRDYGFSHVTSFLPHPIAVGKARVVPAAHETVDEHPSRLARPVVRVLGQYKPDRDLDLLSRLGTILGDDHDLEIVGRGWPHVPGWVVRDEFVSEAELDRLISSSDAVLIPYKRFFQSGIAVRCLELDTAVVGPRASSLAGLYPVGTRLLVDEESMSDATAWAAAVEAATSSEDSDHLENRTSMTRAVEDAWARWISTVITKGRH